MFVKEQVLRFAAAIKHTHVATDITDLDNQYAPKNHKSSNSTYGVGDKNNFQISTTDFNFYCPLDSEGDFISLASILQIVP